MIRFRYNRDIVPPAPFVFLTITDPTTSATRTQVPAQVDTAADRTVIPESLVHDLDLLPTGTLDMGGLGGVVQSLRAYTVLLGIHDLPPSPVKVVASEGEPWVLLGRDMLNQHRILLDGPGLALEL